MALAVGLSNRDRHGRMAMRHRLGRSPSRSVAFRLDGSEKLFSRFHCCAKDHAPEGNVDLKGHPHISSPRRARESPDSRRNKTVKDICEQNVVRTCESLLIHKRRAPQQKRHEQKGRRPRNHHSQKYCMQCAHNERLPRSSRCLLNAFGPNKDAAQSRTCSAPEAGLCRNH